MNKKQQAQRVTALWAIGDLFLGIAKIIVGNLFHSSALIADGIHSFSDLLTDFFVVLVSHFAHEEPDDEHPYGHGRFETLGTVVLGSVLILVAFFLVYDNAMALISGSTQVNPGWPTIIMAAISILVKEMAFRHTLFVGKKIQSSLIIANAWHSRTDAISSIFVLVGLLLSVVGYPWFDEVVAVGVAFFIGKIGLEFLWNSTKELVDTALDAKMVEQMQSEILSVDGVNGTHNLRTRKMGDSAFLDVNIEVSPKISVSEGHEIASWVAKKLIDSHKELADVTVHTDIEDDRPEGETYTSLKYQLLPLRREVEATIWAKISELNLEKDISVQIKETRIHYVQGKIKVEFFCDYDFDHTLTEMINTKCSEIDWLDKIIFWYSR